MKKIYFVLTYTGTILAKIIKFYTRREYSHISISLDEELTQMYSFGRLNAYNPVKGGFVQESPQYGTFKRFKNTKSLIFYLEVTDEQYYKINSLIKYFQEHRQRYKFNTIGLFAVGLKIKWQKENSYYCAEFVKYIIENSIPNIILPEIIKPEDFRKIDDIKKVYEGKLSQYNLNSKIHN